MILDSRNKLGFYLNSKYLLGQGVEIGVQSGIFSEIILSTWRGERLYCIDCWEMQDKSIYVDTANTTNENHEIFFQQTKNRLQKFGERAFVIKEKSVVASSVFEDESLDFVYIDGNHKYEAVKDDLYSWYPKVKKGGVFAGHDYLDLFVENHTDFAVKKAVDEFAQKINTRIETTKEEWPSWFFVKINNL